MNFKLSEITTLENIPAASGIGIHEKHMLIIGDNSPYLYLLDHTAKPLSKIPIYPLDNYKDGEIAKSIKPDFEALELVKGKVDDEVLIFGSGSKSPQRDIFIHVTLAEQPVIKTYNLVSFYNQLRDNKILRGYELNIEAVALYENKLMLFNRGKNLIFIYDYEEFLRFLNSKAPYPPPSVKELELPKINGFVSGFSGATVIPETSTLIFTTSVEDTPNAYDDGEVLGSFICMIDLDRLDEGVKHFLIEDRNQPMKIKVESVTVLNKISESKIEILLVTDSDGGESLLLKGHLIW
ncbi:hypothetical protein EL17_04380 [Anditalea andensis]|uniref:Uncharacterized protein n=2 Tax=Anditalea andensis TaxID=1048983 RepID=A0A074L172_9BACT|nr:hypothetical protein EL17_04380 [Anditalea andensis]